MAETDFTQYNIGPEAGETPRQVIPAVFSTELLASAFPANAVASATFSNTDFFPIWDAFTFCDTALSMQIFVKQSLLDTFRQLGATILLPAGVVSNPLIGVRLPGSFVRIDFTNGPVAGTVVSIQIHARSM